MVQTSFGNQSVGFAGQPVGWPYSNHGRAYCNDKGFEQKVVEFTIAAVDDTDYTISVGGVAVTVHSAVSGATTESIRDQLIDAGRALSQLSGLVSFQPSAAAKLRVTVLLAGSDLAVTEADANITAATLQAASAQEPIPFGLAVVKREGADATDRSATLPSGLADKFIGIAERSTQLTSPTAPDASIKPLSMFTAGTDGTWYATVEVDVAAEDDAFYRVTANGANTQRGAWRNDEDNNGADTAVQAVGCKFKTSALAGGIAELRIKT